MNISIGSTGTASFMAGKTKPDWSAAQYLQFEDERTRPARDLLARVATERPRRVVDIGCGPGNSTELLAARWPDAKVVGFDTSPDMIARAKARLPALRFFEQDAATWTPDAPVDVIFANAVLQWLPDHLGLLATLIDHLAPGGVLAVQMPDNLAEPSHVLMRETAADMPFAAKLAGAARRPLPPVRTYYDALVGGTSRLDIWHTIYNHPLAGPEAVVEWLKSTGLKPFLDRLDATEQLRFIEEYGRRVAAAYPPAADGRTILRFPRLFIVASR